MKKFAAFAGLLLFLAAAAFVWRAEKGRSSAGFGQGQRIISLAPNITETLFELGAGGDLVGVTTYCRFPPEALRIDKVGAFLDPNYEKILSLKPTLILAEKWTSSKTSERLKQLHLPVVETLSPRSFAEIYTMIETIAAQVHRETKGQEIVSRIKDGVHSIEARSRTFKKRPRVYIEIDPPSWTVGRQSFITEAIYLCGGESIFADVNERALQASKEAIVERNPDLIISFPFSVEEIKNRSGWERINAVKNNQIVGGFNADLLTHGNHRILEGMTQLQDLIQKAADSLPDRT